MSKLSIHSRLALPLICLSLACITIFVYRDVATHEFISFDDKNYITENPHVQQGFTIENIQWAFALAAKENKGYWHPLTWLSHTLDCRVFGLSAGKHHLVNLAIHVVNSLMLFLIFYQMTGALWKSGFIAALFALHPINVDSVAWVAERKNVLSTFFWMLTLIAYFYYTRRPAVSRYFLMSLTFLLGLLAKPMLVTLPVILLLLDVWPLGRCSSRSDVLRLGIEKIPLFILAFIIFCLVFLSLHANERVLGTEFMPMGLRIANAVVSTLKYIIKIIWPHPLAVYYPFPDEIPVWRIMGAGTVLAAITALALIQIKRTPWFFAGWFWFLVSLSPVSGIIQGGLWPEMADRWAYVPAVGLFVVIAWGWDAISLKILHRRAISAFLAAVILAGFAFLTQKQVSYWQNSRTLFEHALAAVPENPVSLFNYGAGLAEQGLTDQAIEQYYKALKLQPDYGDVHTNLGNAFYRKGIYDKAVYHYTLAARLKPDSVKTQSDLANAYAALGQFEKALSHYAKALAIEPGNPLIHFNMGVAHYKLHHYDEAQQHFQEAIRIKPDYENAKQALNMLQHMNG